MLHAHLLRNPDCVDRLVEKLEILSRESGEITAGSICSGWGVAEMVCNALNSALARLAKKRDPPKAGLTRGGLEQIWALLVFEN